MGRQTPNLNEMILNARDGVGEDLIIFCGADAFMGRILHDLINFPPNSGAVRIRSIHQYRRENGYYTVRDGSIIMPKQPAGVYANWMIDMYRRGNYNMISFCRYDYRLMEDICRILRQEGVTARVYFMPDKLGYSEYAGRFIFKSPGDDNE